MHLLPVENRIQEAENGCLAACVQAVLAYRNIEQSQRQLNRMLGLTSMGVPFSQITRVERLGVTVNILKGEEDVIKAQLDRGHPLIYPVLTNQLNYWGEANTQHAITVVGYDADSIFVNDPAFDEAPLSIGWIELLLACEIYDYAFATVTP